ncbi:hypothetical protein V8C86DRAFT_3132054 [Haematococcus lacustris]
MLSTVLLACLMLQGVFAQPTPSPPILAPRPPAPPLSTPPPEQSKAMGTPLLITLYGLDLWSLLTSWGSGIQALLEAQQSPSLSLQGLSAPGMCASQLLALNTTALLNTSLTAQELMPGLGYFAVDVSQLLRDYLQDSSITVQVPDFCAGNRTIAPFLANRTLVNGPWPTLRVTINLLTTDPDRLSSPVGPLRQLLVNCRGALTARDSLGFFPLYGMPFHRCQASLVPNSPPPSPSPPRPSPPPSPSPPAPPPPSPPLPPQPPPSPPLPPTNSQLLAPPVNAAKSLPSSFTPPSLTCTPPSLT